MYNSFKCYLNLVKTKLTFKYFIFKLVLKFAATYFMVKPSFNGATQT